jgi:transposase-like protein
LLSPVVERLRQMKLKNAALLVADGIEDTLSYYGFPPEHWRRIRTNNPLERILREVRRQTQVVGSFPDGYAALMLVAARLRHVSGSKWGTRRYLDMDLLRHHLQEAS